MLLQPGPVNPGLQMHAPVWTSHESALSQLQTHVFSQFSPNRSEGHTGNREVLFNSANSSEYTPLVALPPLVSLLTDASPVETFALLLSILSAVAFQGTFGSVALRWARISAFGASEADTEAFSGSRVTIVLVEAVAFFLAAHTVGPRLAFLLA